MLLLTWTKDVAQTKSSETNNNWVPGLELKGSDAHLKEAVTPFF